MLCAAIEIERAPVIGSDEPCKNADDVFRSMPLLRCIVVADDELRPIGLILRNDFLLQLSQRFGRALYENRPVRQLMNSSPIIVSESEDFDAFVRRSLTSGQHEIQDCFILTDEDGRYRGVSNNKAVMTALLDTQGALLSDLESSKTLLMAANERLGLEVGERRAAEEEAIKASNHDPLTALFNRAPFVAQISTWVTAGEPFSLIFIDLDGFKTVNDVYGHMAGDYALKTVAERTTDALDLWSGNLRPVWRRRVRNGHSRTFWAGWCGQAGPRCARTDHRAFPVCPDRVANRGIARHRAQPRAWGDTKRTAAGGRHGDAAGKARGRWDSRVQSGR